MDWGLEVVLEAGGRKDSQRSRFRLWEAQALEVDLAV